MEKNSKIVLSVLCAAAASFLFSGCSNSGNSQDGASQEEKVFKVEVATLSARDVAHEEVYSSTVLANVTNNIAPQSGARIQKVRVDVGDFVYAGQVLAEMDRVQLDQARLKLVNDSTELCRLRGLYEAGGLSQSDYDGAELAYKVSRTSYSNLLENTILRSPIS
ncbi:MAG: biotin/lipoyl-binding protein, partial [Bacteroidales bacterium]|nr:biotin/lipoyl-binding protein [Bacteroidales bacterium]